MQYQNRLHSMVQLLKAFHFAYDELQRKFVSDLIQATNATAYRTIPLQLLHSMKYK